MAINKETITSVFDEKLTLMQWLKTINKALEDAVLTGVEVRQKGNATFSFVVTFEDGTELESNEFVLAQGESINGATIRNGHLYLSLTNGDELDAGNLKPVTSFTINASQHLIVNYGDGTIQDLGAIFSGNVNIDGTINATKVTGDEIVENMSGYGFIPALNLSTNGFTLNYIGAVKNGNKVTFAIAGIFVPNENTENNTRLGAITFPTYIGEKLYVDSLGALNNQYVSFFNSVNTSVSKNVRTIKMSDGNNGVSFQFFSLNSGFVLDTTYSFRFEVTFLLSDNLVG